MDDMKMRHRLTMTMMMRLVLAPDAVTIFTAWCTTDEDNENDGHEMDSTNDERKEGSDE